jgi:hypothetical protein
LKQAWPKSALCWSARDAADRIGAPNNSASVMPN